MNFEGFVLQDLLFINISSGRFESSKTQKKQLMGITSQSYRYGWLDPLAEVIRMSIKNPQPLKTLRVHRVKRRKINAQGPELLDRVHSVSPNGTAV